MKVMVVQKKSKGLEIPIGGVILWYGDSTNVPTGYEIYTDLGDHFAYGGSTTDLTSRGSATHTHTYSATAVTERPIHDHVATSGMSGSAGGVTTGYWSGYQQAATQYHSHGHSANVTEAGNHRHTISATGSGSSLNAYYRLYYIKRVA